MRNRFSKILLFTLTFICLFSHSIFGAKVDGYTVIAGTFDNIDGGISTRSVIQSLIIKDELLTEGKISAEFSNNVKIAQYPVGIVFAGKGIREYTNVSGSNIYYLRACFIDNNIVLGKSENGISEVLKSVRLDNSVFDDSTVKLSVSFSADGTVKIFVNDTEVINTALSPKQLYGGELGICAGGDGNTFKITNIITASLSHTEHTAGEIISEISANCLNDGKKEHSVCTVCGELIYQKEGVWTAVTEAELIIPKDSNNHIDSEESVAWTYDENKHEKSCRCGELLASGNHDIAEDTLEGKCTVCGYNKIHTCDDLTIIHATLGNCVTKGKKEHYRCNDCSKLYIISGNSYIEKTESELESETAPDNHIDSAEALAWTYDDSKHYKICRCGEVLSSEKHDISSDALQGKCSICAYERIHTCTYTEIPEILSDCMTKGRKAHYKCEACKKLYIKNGDVYTEIGAADLETSKNLSNHVDLVSTLEWIHDESGHKKVCRCKAVLVSEVHDIDTDALEGVCSVCGYVKSHTCTYTKIPEVEANCISKGQKLHYKCNACGKLYIKNDGVYTQTSESELVIFENRDEHVDSVKNLTWTYDTYTHTKTCRCGTVLVAGNHTISDSALNGTCATCGYVRTHTCTYTEIPEVPSDCMTKGKIAHYKCEACSKLYIKNGEGYTRIYTDDLDTPKNPSNHVDSASVLDWICDEGGHKKVCRCKTVLAFEEHDIDTDALEGICSVCGYVKSHTCTYTKIPEVEASCISKGQKLHYKCNDCGKIYTKNDKIYTEISESELEIPKDISNHVDSVRDLTWTYDTYTHIKTCRCGVVLATGKHSISDSALSGSCATCGYVRTHTCTYTEIPEVIADCMTKGSVAHYKCEVCSKLYVKNGESYIRIYTDDLDTPKDISNHVDSVSTLPWTHDEKVHKKTCRCGKVLISEAHDILPDALSGTCSICDYDKNHTCKYAKVRGTTANCISSGEKEHYKCSACGNLYLKKGNTYVHVTKNELVLAKDTSNHVDSVNTLPWTHDENTHTKTCRCGNVLVSEAHDIPPDVISGTCSICSYEKEHICEYTYISPTLADCTTDGINEHYKCLVCGKICLIDQNKYIEVSIKDITVKASHKLKKFDAILGNCITESCEEYWKCEICEKLFSDENAENEIENIPKGEKDSQNHTDADKDGKCDLCSYSDTKKESKLVYYILLIAMPILLVLCAVFVIASRKLFVK